MQDLIIVQKTEEMIEYGYKAVKHFPKSERHVLSQELRQSMWQLLRLVIVLTKRYHKKNTLKDVDAELELLRRTIRLAKNLEILPFKKYEVWARSLDEIGRIIGSWLKKAQS